MKVRTNEAWSSVGRVLRIHAGDGAAERRPKSAASTQRAKLQAAAFKINVCINAKWFWLRLAWLRDALERPSQEERLWQV
jgi:hypothetical protein